MEVLKALEKRRIKEIAQKYRDEGYKVIEDPVSKQLPDFLSSFHPDLMVERECEHFVVEVKTRSSLRAEPEIPKMAGLMRGRPDWKFRLVLIGKGDEDEALLNVSGFEDDEILRGIPRAKELLERGFIDAALLLAWSLAEAALRNFARLDGLSFNPTKPQYVVKALTYEGVLEQEEHDFLYKVIEIHNKVAHGFRTEKIDVKMIEKLLAFTQNMVESPPLYEEAA